MNSSVRVPPPARSSRACVEHFAQVLHAAGHRRELPELPLALRGQQPGQRRLAGARRAIEDHRAEPIGRQQPAQQLPFAQKVLLADELVERRGRIRAASGWAWRKFSASDLANRLAMPRSGKWE